MLFLYKTIYGLVIFGAGLIPFSKVNNKLVYLLGRDNLSKKWCDFGGKSENYETQLETAAREGYEELNGVLGSKEYIKKQIITTNLPMLKTNNQRHACYLMRIKYDKHLPLYINNNIKFINKHVPTIVGMNGLYEKSKVRWFSQEELNSTTEFRDYFKEIVWKLDKKYSKLLELENDSIV
jgi:hypothetical protein